METGPPRGRRSPRATPAGRSTSPPCSRGDGRGAPRGRRGHPGERRAASPRARDDSRRGTRWGRGAASALVPALPGRRLARRWPRVLLWARGGHGWLSAPRPRASAPHLLPRAPGRTQAAIGPDRQQRRHTQQPVAPPREEEEEKEGGRAGAERGSRRRKNVAKPRADSAPPCQRLRTGASHPF